MLKVFIGFDPRQPIAYNVAQYSVALNSSKPVEITPLILKQLPVNRCGLTQFTYSRFLVPYLCNYTGTAVFMDPDMVVTGDISELFAIADPTVASIHVMRQQPKFEWASLIVFNNSVCRKLTPEYIEDPTNKMFDFAWANNGVADIPLEWNHCVGYQEPKDAKLYHYTQGIPCWQETKDLEAEPWDKAFQSANSTVSWAELMGPSVHAKHVIARLNRKDA